jgi:hypothetical protein
VGPQDRECDGRREGPNRNPEPGQKIKPPLALPGAHSPSVKRTTTMGKIGRSNTIQVHT